MTRSVFGDDDYFNGKVFLFYLRANKEYRGPIFQKWTMTFGDTLPDTILKSKSKEEQKYEACAANWQLMEEQQIVVQGIEVASVIDTDCMFICFSIHNRFIPNAL